MNKITLINKFVPGMLEDRELVAKLIHIHPEDLRNLLAKNGGIGSFSDVRIRFELEQLFHLDIEENKHRRYLQFNTEDMVVLVEREDRKGILKYHFSVVRIERQRRGLLQNLRLVSA